MYWPSQIAGLSDRFTQLQRHIVPGGAIWAVIPKKQFAQIWGLDFTWPDMVEVALGTDLVDNKTLSLSEEEYATRFVIRKNRRNKHA